MRIEAALGLDDGDEVATPVGIDKAAAEMQYRQGSSIPACSLWRT